MAKIALTVFNLIGNALPLAILCYIIVFLIGGKKIKIQTLISYVVVAVVCFIILLR